MLEYLRDNTVSGIYEIKNLNDGKKYIGSSRNVYYRWSTHIRALKRGKHRNKYLQNAWNKHGKDVFAFSLVIVCEVEELYYYEQSFLDTGGYEYNIALDATAPTRGRKLTKEHRRKISEAHKGKTYSNETRKNISQSKLGKNNPMYGVRGKDNPLYGRSLPDKTKKKISETLTGKKLSTEHRRHISEGNMGREVTEDTRIKLSMAQTGRRHTDEARKKISRNHADVSREHNPFYGKSHTDKARELISIAHRGENNSANKLTKDQVLLIRAMEKEAEFERGDKMAFYRFWATKFNVTCWTIKSVVNNYSWKHLQEAQ